MSAQPVASVLISATDREDQLAPLLASLAAQTYPAWEIVIVAKNLDRAKAACTETGIPDDKVRIVQALVGLATCRNQLMQHALGSLVSFASVEDRWSPDKLERQVEILTQEPQLGALFTRVRHIDAAGLQNKSLSRPFNENYSEEELAHRLLQGNVLAFTTGLLRKPVMEKVGEFNDALPMAQDYDFILRALLETGMKILPEELVEIHVADGELSAAMCKRVSHDSWQVICRHAGGIMRRWPLLPHTTFAFLTHVADLATVAEDWQVVVDYLNIKRQCFGHDDKDCLRILDCLIKQGRLAQAEALLRTMKNEQGEFEPENIPALDSYFDRLGITQ